MLSKEKVTLIGAPPSPYTRKMIALLRYRSIPYEIIWGDPGQLLLGEGILAELGIEVPKPVLLPTFIMRNEEGELKTVTDSTPIIRRLEKEFEGRSVIPSDPALCFLNYLLEDFGDEWVTKYMFHYRWHFEEDADNAASLLPLNSNVNLAPENWEVFKNYIGPRQIERLWVVGSNDTTAPIIEESYKRFLKIMEDHLQNLPFLLGKRPSSSDFAIYGQLTQLIGFDPTSRKLAHEISLRTVAWINSMEDLSGLNPKNNPWTEMESLPESMRELLTELGRGYVPALLANRNALEKGEEEWEAQIDNAKWTQKTFNYQGKCLQWINQEFYSLTDHDQQRVHELIKGTGCEKLLLKK